MFTAKQLEELEYEELPEGYVWVTDEEIDDQSRWETFYSRTFKVEATDKYFTMLYSRGSTEYQETDWNPTFVEVRPVEQTVTVYVNAASLDSKDKQS